MELFKGAPVPDALLVDGCGRLHPEQNGLACHIAQHLDTLGHKFPVVGVAKNMFWFNGLSVKDDWRVSRIPSRSRCAMVPCAPSGSVSHGETQVYHGESKRHVFVSVGGNCSLEEAVKIVQSCAKTRVPEPIKIADRFTRKV